jgi:hypothetical protein
MSSRQAIVVSLVCHALFYVFTYPFDFLEQQMGYEVMGVDGE